MSIDLTSPTAGAPVPTAGPADAISVAEKYGPLVMQLHEISGKDYDVCVQALANANGNIDLAAAELMGF